MQFKSLGEQIEFFLNPNNLDLWELQKSFQTLISRYYHAKLTSRTLFSLQDPINEIEKICEIIALISNKKATKKCEKGINILRAELYVTKKYDLIDILNDLRQKQPSELTNAMTEDSDWFELASYLQKILRVYFKKCQQNYEFQEIIRTSMSGWPEAWRFLKDNLPVLTVFGGVAYTIMVLFTKYGFINELKNKHLVVVLNAINLDSQIEILKIMFIALIFMIIISSISVSTIFRDTNIILNKNEVKTINGSQAAREYIVRKIVTFLILLVAFSVGLIIVNMVLYYSTRYHNSIYVSIAEAVAVIIVIAILRIIAISFGQAIYSHKNIVDFLVTHLYDTIKFYKISYIQQILWWLLGLVVITAPMLFSLMFVLVNNNAVPETVPILDYIIITEIIAVPLIAFIFIEMTVHSVIGKICSSVMIYLVASWFTISNYINYLEFLGLRNNANTISLLKITENESTLTEQLRDMGFHQLQYNGNESQVSGLQFERYVFAHGIESTIYFAGVSESQPIYLAELESYIASNKNVVCNSKLNQAVLSEFESGDESGHYFGYEGCKVNINSFKLNEKIKLVNKLFLVRQSESDYTYWIFGAHVNYKKQDDTLIISAAKNDNFNTITLNKGRGMLYYEETTLRINESSDALHNFALTRYGNESSQSY